MASSENHYIPALTPNNVTKIPFGKMLKILEPYVLEHIPEGIGGDPGALREVDRLIGRLANMYAYFLYLFVVVSNRVNTLKSMGAEQEDVNAMIKRKEALQKFAEAIKEKHRAASRMVTINIEEDRPPFDRVDYKARSETKRNVKSWGGVGKIKGKNRSRKSNK